MEIKDEERMATIPLIAHELITAKLMKVIKWLVAIIAVLLVIIGVGVYEITSCDFATVTIDSDDCGVANYLEAGTSGVINNAKNYSQEADSQNY